MKISKLKIAILSTATILAIGCSGSGDNTKKAATTESVIVAEETKLVSIAGVESKRVDDIVQYNGTIEPYKKNNISSATPFRIEKIYVEVGDKVKKGAKIAQMEQSQYIQQEIQVENLITDLNRMEELYKVGGASNQQLEQLRTQHDVAQKALDYLKKNTLLRSPIDGVVTARYYDDGDLLSGANGVVTVMQMNKLKVRINISEYLFTKVKKGMSVDITTDSYGSEVFKGEISLIYPYIDAATHTFAVEVVIPNSGLRLRPGMFSYVDISFGEKDIIAINNKAIQKQIGSNEKYIYMVTDSKAERRVVEVGNYYGDVVEIIEGVSIDDKIVLEGAGRLISGDKLRW